MQDVLNSQKSAIIERLGVYFEKEKNSPPLAARILATLISNGNKGTTFDQLVNDLGASKSTISTHLTNLEHNNSITYYTKCGDRKRYYILKPGYITRKITAQINQWDTEIVIQKEVLAYKKNYNREQQSEDRLPVDFHKLLLQFLEDAVQYLEKQLVIYQSKEEKYNSKQL